MHVDVLPIVKPETCFSVEHEIEDGKEKAFIKRMMRNLMNKNPILGLWVKQFSKTSKDPMSTMVCALVLYRLLESQDEADYMNDIF